MGSRFVCLLLCAAVAYSMPAQLEGAQELVQVGAGKDELPANMDEMKAMINGAMKQTYSEDLGEDDQASEAQDMKATMDKIAERNAIADEMMVEEKRDSVLEQWSKWSKCTKKCGGGEIKRQRKIRVHDQNGGEPCPGYNALQESASCNTESCEDQTFDSGRASQGECLQQQSAPQSNASAFCGQDDDRGGPLDQQERCYLNGECARTWGGNSNRRG